MQQLSHLERCNTCTVSDECCIQAKKQHITFVEYVLRRTIHQMKDKISVPIEQVK
jgi:hypothetical protein